MSLDFHVMWGCVVSRKNGSMTYSDAQLLLGSVKGSKLLNAFSLLSIPSNAPGRFGIVSSHYKIHSWVAGLAIEIS